MTDKQKEKGSETLRWSVDVRGRVQGVGFRPFVYRIAQRHKIGGYVTNTPYGVHIEVEGTKKSLTSFKNALVKEKPPLAEIRNIFIKPMKTKGETDFVVKESKKKGRKEVVVPPDVSVCKNCQEELFSPKDRRFGYPFINCTDCGPRFTIVEDVPYDRERTTMKEFEMCTDCRREYEDPSDRRFHAQPDACAVCGPFVYLLDSEGKRVECREPIEEAAKLLKEGKIIAIKGLGGFHLACDGTNPEAVKNLRMRKRRPYKPLAIMVSSLEEARKVVKMNGVEEELLTSWRAPILLCQKRENSNLAENLAPHLAEAGVMLAYTPLHLLLLHQVARPLVMTSGNRQDEPTIKDETVALSDLKGIADYFLSHNRPIVVHNDDSVVRVMGETPVMIRRARGWTPQAIKLPALPSRDVLSLGAEEKNTITLTRYDEAFISQHLGDMRNLRTFEAFENVLNHFKRILQVEPQVVVCDMHPNYFTTKFSKRFSLPVLQVQHHHAHILSCLAENNTTKPVLGVCFDGIGYGADGKIWGCEFIYVNGRHYERFGHLKEIALPGGESAIKQPWRTAVAQLFSMFGSRMLDLSLPMFEQIPNTHIEPVLQLLQQNLNIPYASSLGRFFDSVAALCGVCYENSYEGQAPAELESLLYKIISSIPEHKENVNRYHYKISYKEETAILETEEILASILSDIAAKRRVEEISLSFHETICRAAVELCKFGAEKYAIKRVALSGGSFQNRYLYLRTKYLLEAQGFEVLTHSQVPPNDAGISLGQALFAKLAKNRREKNYVSCGASESH
ncbi:MAG: carbamoyltransferase HypF [Planctomycetota bacterium]|nr:carbamoyltransferase HypF [Planctomycetota bacterium]